MFGQSQQNNLDPLFSYRAQVASSLPQEYLQIVYPPMQHRIMRAADIGVDEPTYVFWLGRDAPQ